VSGASQTFDLEKWFNKLARQLVSVADSDQRSRLFSRRITRLNPDSASTALSWVLQNGFCLRDIPSRLAAEAAMFAIVHDYWPDAHRVSTYDAAIKCGERLSSIFLFDYSLLEAEDDNDDKIQVPAYNSARPLTLGERRSLAARPSRELIELALRDPHPMVAAKLLENPKLTEDDVVYMATRRPAAQAALIEIAVHRRWRQNQRVARALVKNPALPPFHVLTLLPGLDLPTVTEIAKDRRQNNMVREASAEFLRFMKIKKGNFLS
jgi:hypothetical protein